MNFFLCLFLLQGVWSCYDYTFEFDGRIFSTLDDFPIPFDVPFVVDYNRSQEFPLALQDQWDFYRNGLGEAASIVTKSPTDVFFKLANFTIYYSDPENTTIYYLPEPNTHIFIEHLPCPEGTTLQNYCVDGSYCIGYTETEIKQFYIKERLIGVAFFLAIVLSLSLAFYFRKPQQINTVSIQAPPDPVPSPVQIIQPQKEVWSVDSSA